MGQQHSDNEMDALYDDVSTALNEKYFRYSRLIGDLDSKL